MPNKSENGFLLDNITIRSQVYGFLIEYNEHGGIQGRDVEYVEHVEHVLV